MRDYWVVMVTDLSSGRESRFYFYVQPELADDLELAEKRASADAWACWAKATHHGFVARAEHVKRHAPVSVSA